MKYGPKPMASVDRARSAVERFWEHVYCDPNTGCFFWTAARNDAGYGLISASRNDKWTMLLAHRFSYETFVGPIGDLLVCHSCESRHEGIAYRACVNPDHLWLGTDADNLADMCAKGRHGRGNAKITKEQMAEIVRRVSAGELQKHLAAEMGISRGRVCTIMKEYA